MNSCRLFAVGASVHIVGQTCLDDVAFLTVDGFCAESGNLDVGVSDAKEFKSVVHEHSRLSFVNEQVNYWESASLSPHPPAVVSGG